MEDCTKAHYDRIGSRKTPKRWLTAILHKLSLICWNLWDFRNNVLHAPAGPLAVAQHYRLNQDIEEEFALGTADIGRHDYPLIRKWTVARLHACDIVTKKQFALENADLRKPISTMDRRETSLVRATFLPNSNG